MGNDSEMWKTVEAWLTGSMQSVYVAGMVIQFLDILRFKDYFFM